MRALCMLAVYFAVSLGAAAQMPPAEPVVTPVTGLLVRPLTEGLALFNPADGSTRVIAGVYDTPVWSPDGSRIAVTSPIDPLPEVSGFVVSPGTGDVLTLITGDYATLGIMQPTGWSQDGTKVIYSFVLPAADASVWQGRFVLFNVTTEDGMALLHVMAHTPIRDVFDVRAEIPDEAVFDMFYAVYWNPVYTDWLYVQPEAVWRDAEGEYLASDAGVFNWLTGEYVSFSTLFPQEVISGTEWSADGTKIALNTFTGITVVGFGVDDSGAPQLSLVADGIDSDGQAVLTWLGVDDMLITGTSLPYRTSFIAQIIDGEWHSQEFLADTGGVRWDIIPGRWHLTAGEDEQRRLRELFAQAAP